MPTIAPGDKILVTGANGFLAVHVVDSFLKKGYSVRGVVRSLGKGDHLKKLFAKYGDKFELAVVEDITAVCIVPFPFRGHPSGLIRTAEKAWSV